MSADPVGAAPVSVEAGALYNRYRPQRLVDVVGQDHVTVPLGRALAGGRMHHALLLSGPHGCGKTTTARIIAAAMVCDEAPTATPCGACPPCRAVAHGSCIDIVEIDAASNGGVDDARALRDTVAFAPVMAKRKVFLIDEAHMITTAGFNALLKTVEEPPDYVSFIFATTEPEKVIPTIRSRTHAYRLHFVEPTLLAAHVQSVAAQEGASLETGVLPLLVRASGGSVRNALSLLGQALDGSQDSVVRLSEATALVGAASDVVLDDVMASFARGDAASVLASLGGAVESGAEPRRVAEDLLDRFRDVLVFALTGSLPGVVGLGGPNVSEVWRELVDKIGVRGLTAVAEDLMRAVPGMPSGGPGRVALEVVAARAYLSIVDAMGLPAVTAPVIPARTSVANPPAVAVVPTRSDIPVVAEVATPMTEVSSVEAQPVDPWSVAPPSPNGEPVPYDAPTTQSGLPVDPEGDATWEGSPLGETVNRAPSLPVEQWSNPTESWSKVLTAILQLPRGRVTHTLLAANSTPISVIDGVILLKFTSEGIAATARNGGYLTRAADAACSALGGAWVVRESK